MLSVLFFSPYSFSFFIFTFKKLLQETGQCSIYHFYLEYLNYPGNYLRFFLSASRLNLIFLIPQLSGLGGKWAASSTSLNFLVSWRSGLLGSTTVLAVSLHFFLMMWHIQEDVFKTLLIWVISYKANPCENFHSGQEIKDYQSLRGTFISPPFSQTSPPLNWFPVLRYRFWTLCS